MMLTLYLDGNSGLHRCPAGVKLAVLALSGLLIYGVQDVRWLGVALAVAVGLLWYSGAGWRHVWRQLRGLLWLIGLLCLFLALFDSPARALIAGLRVLTVCALALVVTFTTRTQAMLAVVERLLQPLARRGWVDAGRVALAIGLVLRFVPEILQQYAALREAQQARGMTARPWSLLVPLIVRTLRRADEIADAIDARDGARPHAAQPRRHD